MAKHISALAKGQHDPAFFGYVQRTSNKSATCDEDGECKYIGKFTFPSKYGKSVQAAQVTITFGYTINTKGVRTAFTAAAPTVSFITRPEEDD